MIENDRQAFKDWSDIAKDGIKSVGDLEEARRMAHTHVKEHDTRNAPRVKEAKRRMEIEAFEGRATGFKHKVMNAFDARINELSDKTEVPMPVLLNTMVKMLPRQVEGSINHNFTFADMVAKCSIELEKLETIDVESKELDEQESGTTDTDL